MQIRNRLTSKVIFEADVQSMKELVELAVKNKINLSDASLLSADLAGASLPNVNLAGANLSGADLSGANLSCANLFYANLSGADLYNANLTDANLYSANLTDASLYNANLTDANLYSANLTDASLYNANLTDANLYSANFVNNKGSKMKVSTVSKSITTAETVLPGQVIKNNGKYALCVANDSMPCSFVDLQTFQVCDVDKYQEVQIVTNPEIRIVE